MSTPAAIDDAQRRRERGRTLVGKGAWAVVDQALFAGSNYIVSWLLTRWLSRSEFGAYSTAFNAFLLLSVIHTSLLTEPMLVFAPGQFKEKLSRYLGTLMSGHVVISLGASLLLLIGAAGYAHFGQGQIAAGMYWFALTAPFTLFLWIMRRACYAIMNPRRAAEAGGIYLVLMIAGLLILHHLSIESIGGALVLMAACSLAVGLWLYQTTAVQWSITDRALMREVGVSHLHYGKWSLPTAMMGFIPANVYYFLLPGLMGLEESGALRALSNLYAPLMTISSALCLLLLPVFVKQRGTSEGRATHRLALLLLAGGPAVYWLVLGLVDRPLIHLVYAGKYDQYSALMWIMGLAPIVAGFSNVYGSLLRAHEKMQAVFWAGLVSAVAAIILGVELTRHFGMAGVCWSIVITYGLHHLTLWLFSRAIHCAGESVDSTMEAAVDSAVESAGEVDPALQVELGLPQSDLAKRTQAEFLQWQASQPGLNRPTAGRGVVEAPRVVKV